MKKYKLGVLNHWQAVIKKIIACVLILQLTGCQLTEQKSYDVGPQANRASDAVKTTPIPQLNQEIYLDAVVPVFDPGIPSDYQEQVDDNIWPQLRRAEANRFAVQTKNALIKTGAFASVNVVPNNRANAELFVLGEILESDSETLSIEIKLVDISGQLWRKKKFSYEVSGAFYRDLQNEEKDAYEPLFDEIAVYVVEQLSKVSEEEKQRLKYVNELRFAQSIAPAAFEQHLQRTRKGGYQVNSLPSEDDPMWQRIETLQVQEQLFLDRMQSQYDGFNLKTNESYLMWQSETFQELARAQEAENQALVRGILGGLLVIGAIIVDSNSDSVGSEVFSAASTIGGAMIIKSAMDNHAQGKVHQAIIDELGESIDIEMSPQVIEMEDKTVELKGTAAEQYSQWRAHLKSIYQLEKTPDIDL